MQIPPRDDESPCVVLCEGRYSKVMGYAKANALAMSYAGRGLRSHVYRLILARGAACGVRRLRGGAVAGNARKARSLVEAEHQTTAPRKSRGSSAGDSRTRGVPVTPRVHLLVDGYRQIACGDGDGVPPGDDDTCAISKATCPACLHRSFAMYEAMTEAIAVRLVEIGETKL